MLKNKKSDFLTPSSDTKLEKTSVFSGWLEAYARFCIVSQFEQLNWLTHLSWQKSIRLISVATFKQ